MIKIIDNFIEKKELDDVISEWSNLKIFQDKKESTRYKNLTDSTCTFIEMKMLKEAEKYFYTSDVRGYEVWTHNRDSASNIGWHIDTPHYSMEGHRNRTPKLGDTWPVCSIILYVEVSKDLDGANLEMEMGFGEVQTIIPESNRYVVFGPGINHRTTNSTKGKRISINVNPYMKSFDQKYERLW